jgi:hypothetical protein
MEPMNAKKPDLFLLRGLMPCAVALIVAVAGSPVQAKKLPAPSADDQTVVECQLPPQIRSLGMHTTYLAAGRQISTTIADCKVRGGKYDGHGPGALAAQAPATPAGATAVTVGGDQSKAACPKSGMVAGLKGGGALSVRAAPGATSGKIDKLGIGKHVFMCDWSGNGAWVGVVYPGATGVDCGVSKTIDRPQPYTGACRSGWVSSKYLKPVIR